MSANSSETLRLIQRSSEGDQDAWRLLLQRHRDRLRQMVDFRLDRRLRGRIDPSDVIQESYIEAARRLDDYRSKPPMPFFLWLRWLAAKKLMHLHRHHLGVQARDASRDVSLFRSPLPVTSTAVLAERLMGREASPSQAAMDAEIKIQLQEAINSMSELDREVIALRHFEQLTNVETAEVLGVDASAASNRYLRAIARLKRLLEANR